MRTRIKEVQGIDWFDAAILNAQWTGPLLRDILIRAGVQDGQNTDLHVHLASTRTKVQDDEWYGSSIPLAMALDEGREAVLALKMNGEPLPGNHGFPVRAIIPGIIGARSVKWIDRITVAETETSNFYQQRDYKVLPPDATDTESAAKFWETVPPMMENVINSVVIVPNDDDTIERSDEGTITIKGYAVPQGEHGPVVKVEKWSWVLWEAVVRVDPGDGVRIFSRATDEGGNSQTEHRSRWNLRGVGYNGYESRTGVKIL
ncbi:hypothetical protein LTR96_011685 [Exophiala xenobiotica]|nr:hypothetical protein LTS06_004869 [Exophiala xenobiotica]KAK5262840.1 hypothetical protein LTR96_011685 [Exophiala xenobiotica]KAK5311620.1 hypothetical protein LTR93_011667 [Exophiala xenobiotica]KAK5332172.1 hypothetical protein LTR98_011686 [Exophiala xenobiotica]KAK5345750.1 hypothetical protein LTR61_010451 [Exophiala xenobiotica]